MSVDILQEKIRKCKNPAVLCLEPEISLIPPALLADEENLAAAYGSYCTQLLTALQGVFPAVRIGYHAFAVLGAEGLTALDQVRHCARELGYYLIADLDAGFTGTLAKLWGEKILEQDGYDAMTVTPYPGSDVAKQYLDHCKAGKMILAQIKTPNKTGPELQDLLSGGRLVYIAAADLVYRWGQNLYGRCGYRQVGAMMAANSADSLRSVRTKYKELFILVSGLDVSGGNAKNASFAFDRLGHGAAVCVGTSILGAWQEVEDCEDYIACAKEAAERVKKNIGRYVTVW